MRNGPGSEPGESDDEREQKGGRKRREERSAANPDGGVLGGGDECVAVTAELTVQHRLGVSQQRGEGLPRGHLQHLGGKRKGTQGSKMSQNTLKGEVPSK